MSANTIQKKEAKEFSDRWKDKGYEKGESQKFWCDLLEHVFGIKNYVEIISFENRVKLNKTSFIDAYIKPTHVLIEQKSICIDLNKRILQSDGTMLTPYEQAKRYNNELKYSEKARWIVLCNFKEFHIYDMEKMDNKPEIILLSDLPKEYHRLQPLVKNDVSTIIKKEEQVSIDAGKIVGLLYDKIGAQYIDKNSLESQKALNKLCVCLVFCLYAEDAGIFGNKNMFHDYMENFPASVFHWGLKKLFKVLDTRPEDREEYKYDNDLIAFPYVNGGLFSGDIEIPLINDEIRSLILQKASEDFDWSGISPTIFGAVFESTLNPETRRAGGMHYTSIENIHKVIDPLFLDDLKAEFAAINATAVAKTKREKAIAFQNKLAGLTFFDPACGSGNFLTETYIWLRRLENEAIRIIGNKRLTSGNKRLVGGRFMGGMTNPIKVSINQFYGIEINDFACAVAQTALWIAEAQMLQETNDIVGFDLDPLPLKKYTNIHEGNALRMDWNEVIPASDLNYIMGNPPFSGARIMSGGQKEDLRFVFGERWKNLGNMDYVTGWYKKSQAMMSENTAIRAALVSTNSVTQGEQVANLWKPLMESGIHIDFAWRTFIWNSEAAQKAHVHCVIIGFSACPSKTKRKIFEDGNIYEVSNINASLMDDANVFVESRSTPLCDVPEICTGNQPIDDGNYLFSDEEKDEFVRKEPASEKYFRRWYGSDEFINRRPRWCLWLGDVGDVNPVELLKLPECMKRVNAVREFRRARTRKETVKLADHPTRFQIENMPKSKYLFIPETSSGCRDYIPMEFMNPDVLCSNATRLIPDATLYHFGVLTSLVHNAWNRVIGGRLKSDCRYSKKIVYNNFPWPAVSARQREKIEQTAQAILDARKKYSEASFADMYGNMVLFPELLQAHRANDAAVMEAYGFDKNLTEPQIINLLLQQYQKLIKQKR